MRLKILFEQKREIERKCERVREIEREQGREGRREGFRDFHLFFQAKSSESANHGLIEPS